MSVFHSVSDLIGHTPLLQLHKRVQENLIGHLLVQKRLKLSPTLFIATLDSELEVISVCNMSGEVIKETLGTRKRTTLSPSLASFLNSLKPVL